MMANEKDIPGNEPVLGAKNSNVIDENTESKISQDVDDKLIGDDKELDEMLKSARAGSGKPGNKKNNY
ncbi:MAG: hypothetical protein ABJB11_05085 [Ferruginibacter sp.]